MSFSLFNPDESEAVELVFLLDFDDTIAAPERNPDGSYNIQSSGHIHAEIINKDLYSSRSENISTF